jgi:hypothetical protein
MDRVIEAIRVLYALMQLGADAVRHQAAELHAHRMSTMDMMAVLATEVDRKHGLFGNRLVMCVAAKRSRNWFHIFELR